MSSLLVKKYGKKVKIQSYSKFNSERFQQNLEKINNLNNFYYVEYKNLLLNFKLPVHKVQHLNAYSKHRIH